MTSPNRSPLYGLGRYIHLAGRLGLALARGAWRTTRRLGQEARGIFAGLG